MCYTVIAPVLLVSNVLLQKVIILSFYTARLYNKG